MNSNTPVKKNSSSLSAKAPRGRPRSVKARERVLAAARALLDEGGLAGVTMEAISARADVSKPTIYRTWTNAHAVVMSALMETPGEKDTPPRSRGAGLVALRLQLRAIVDVFSSKTGRSVTHVLAAADPGTEISKVFRNHFILARREEGRTFLREAVQRNEVRKDLDLEVALDLLYAPIFYRILVGHAPLNEAFAGAALGELLRGLAPRRGTGRVV